MNADTAVAFDPAALAAFAGTLGNLPKEEIQKAKKLYILNAIADFQAQRASGKTMLIVFGVMCIIPIFLIIFVPALLMYQNGITAAKQKILNAVEIWKDDLGADYERIRTDLLR
jgi:hypothetical protein